MRYLIDTYNIIHAAGAMGGSLGEMTVRRLCQYLVAGPNSVKATLIMDGRAKPDEPSTNEFPDVDLVYSGAGVPADAVIAGMVERSTSRKKLTVVSNDRAVAAHARRHFAHAISCEQFIERLTRYNARASFEERHGNPPQKATGTPTTGEADHWMREFGFDDVAADETPPPRAEHPPDDGLGGLRVEDLLGPKG